MAGTSGTTRSTGDGTQDLVDELADELGRSVVVNDPAVHLLCASRHFGDEDDVRIRAVLQRDAGPEVSAHVLAQGVARWSRAGVVVGSAELGMRDRLCVPLRERGELLGLLMVIDAEHTLTEGERARIERVSRSIAAVLHRERATQDRERTEREQTVSRLLGTDAEARAVAAREADRWLAGATHVAVTVLQVRDQAVREADAQLALATALASAARRHPRRTLTAIHGHHAVLVHTGAHLTRADLAERAERVLLGLRPLLPDGAAAVAGIGDTVDGLTKAWRSHAHARVAARAALLLPGLGPVADWDALGPYAILLRLPDAALGPDLIPAPVARLLAHEKAGRLVDTLRVLLDHAGSMPRTAEALNLHRTSLYYRLDQIRAITGLDLDDGRDRLLLHLGLLVADLVTPTPNGETSQ